jgi:hypothetical protein
LPECRGGVGHALSGHPRAPEYGRRVIEAAMCCRPRRLLFAGQPGGPGQRGGGLFLGRG